MKSTSYSGSNPFMSHTRTAFIRLTVYLRDKTSKKHVTTDSQIIRVVQVKRVVNPTGIYRKAGNNDSFKVDLMELESAYGSQFYKISSRGPWMAEVIGHDDFIKLNGRHKVIWGSTDTPVTFDINFNKMNLDNNVRSAVVRIRYNNYTCVHLILVRQGYEPQELAGTKWRISNLRHNALASVDHDPRDEGSMFKRGNINDAIHPVNNEYNNSTGIPSSFPTWQQSLYLCTPEGASADVRTPWANFDGRENFPSSSDIVEMTDYDKLYMNPYIEFAFGVLYADGATRTADNIEDAYGYYYEDSDCGKRGMRGLFAYHWNPGGSDAFMNDPENNTRSIFFPLGRSGYGHRRSNDANIETGILRYSCGRTGNFPDNLIPYSPLFYDLYMRQGAIYWAKSMISGGTIHDSANGNVIKSDDNGVGLDINFFTYDVNYISENNVYKKDNANAKSDACFVRMKAK